MKKLGSLATVLVVFSFALVLSGNLKADAFTGMHNSDPAQTQILKAFIRLNLTDQQKQEIAAILKAYQDDILTAVDAVVVARENLVETIHGTVYDESAVRKASQGVASAEEELAVLHAKVVSELKGVLTDEQLSKIEQLKSDILDRVKSRIDKIKALIDLWITNNS